MASSSSNDAHAWEMSKENAAPLARGRNVRTFESSLVKQKKSNSSSDGDDEEDDRHRMMQHFERLLKNPSDDPLIHWLSYIKFHQDAFPTDTNAQFLLMERCARALMTCEQYRDDTRFIRVCVLYADQTTHPGDVFKYLHQHKIGTRVALFWIAWAWVAETKGDFAFAEKVFTKGIGKDAQPLHMLKQRHKQFQRRASKYWLKQQQEQDEANEEEEQQSGRATLGGLTERRVQRNDRRSRPAARSNQPPAQTSSSSRTFVDRSAASQQTRPVSDNNGAAPAGGFAIFTDENADPDNDDAYELQDQAHAPPLTQQRVLETEADRKKENTQQAERWNERGGYSSRATSRSAPAPRAPTAPSFGIHVDDECQAKRDKELQQTKDQFRAFRDREGVDRSEKLARDPMRYIANPEKLKQDDKKTRNKEDPSSTVGKGKTAKGSKPETTSKSKPSTVCGFSKKLVAKDDQGQECCFEEYRAKNQLYKLTNASTNFNFLAREIMDSDDDSSSEDVEMEEDDDDQQTVQSSASHGRRVLFSMNVSVDHNNHTSFALNASTASSATGGGVIAFSASREEETINTKFAMKELSMMFSSPATGVGATSSETKQALLEAQEQNVMEDDDDDAAHGVNNSILRMDSGGFTVYQEEEEEVDQSNDQNEEAATAAGGGFQIFQEEPPAAKTATREGFPRQKETKKRNGFQIFGDAPASQEKPEKKAFPIFADKLAVSEEEPKKSGFQIFSEEAEAEEKKTGFQIFSEQAEVEGKKEPSFQIFGENSEVDVKKNGFQILEEGPEEQGGPKQNGFQVFNEEATEKEEPKKTGFQIFSEQAEIEEKKTGFQIFTEEAEIEEKKSGFQIFTEEAEVEEKKTGFQIFREEAEVEEKKTGFQIFSEGAEVEEKKTGFQVYSKEAEVEAEKGPSKNGFEVFCEETEVQNARAPFAIRRDKVESADDDSAADDGGGDTATLSLFGEAMDVMNELYQSKEESKSVDISKVDRIPFSICADNDDDGDKGYDSAEDEPAMADGGGDTATLSLFGDAMEALQDLSLTQRDEVRPRRPSSLSIPGGDTSLDDFRKYRARDSAAILTDGAAFGDISLIETDATRLHLSPTMTGTEVFATSLEKIDYKTLHKDNVRCSLRNLDREASHASKGIPFAGPETDLALMLSKKGNILALRNQSMPVGLKRKASAQGAEIKVGSRSGVVKHELGRGSYGVVVLLDSADQGVIAVKAQCPTDCLAWEYVLMKRLEDRTKNHAPFPKPLSFVSLSDGALLSMTAGSQNGMNLVDINNVYHVREGGPVPELIALHYTSRMLKHIETLHWHGKMLHCDVKPDNWVVVASDAAFSGCTELVEASDLMLVDFGRAVDLTTAAREGVDPMDVKLAGHAAAEDMACAAMRMNLGWSFDIDTFGICASAHVLLYGSHIEMDMGRSKHWKLRKPLRRYWQKELWTELFDTLLNLDDISRTAIGSRPRSLRLLRGKIEAYVATRAKELESLLKHQARVLPKKRLA